MAVSATQPAGHTDARWRKALRRRYREFALIARDPVLMIGLLYCGLFLYIFVAYPLYRGTFNGFFDSETGDFSLTHWHYGMLRYAPVGPNVL